MAKTSGKVKRGFAIFIRGFFLMILIPFTLGLNILLVSQISQPDPEFEVIITLILLIPSLYASVWLIGGRKIKAAAERRKRKKADDARHQKRTQDTKKAVENARAAISQAKEVLNGLEKSSGDTQVLGSSEERIKRSHMLDPIRECVKRIYWADDLSVFFAEYDTLKKLSAELPKATWSGDRPIWVYALLEFPEKLHCAVDRAMNKASFITNKEDLLNTYDAMLSALGVADGYTSEGVTAIQKEVENVARAMEAVQGTTDEMEKPQIGEHGPFIHFDSVEDNSYFDPPENECPELSFNQAYMLRYYSGRKTDYVLYPYLIQEYGPECEYWLSMFLSKRFLTTEPIEDSLRIYAMADFGRILENHGLSTSGKKADLMQRLLENVNHAELHEIFPIAHYRLTDKGKHELEFYTVRLFLQGNSWPYDDKATTDFIQNRLSFVAAGIYRSDEQVLAAIRERRRHEDACKDLGSYSDVGEKEYEFMAGLDEKTCEGCGMLDGRHFPVEQAIVGLNYPPIHNNCRCTTIEYDPEDAADWAAAGVPMPQNKTWEQWKAEQSKV